MRATCGLRVKGLLPVARETRPALPAVPALPSSVAHLARARGSKEPPVLNAHGGQDVPKASKTLGLSSLQFPSLVAYPRRRRLGHCCRGGGRGQAEWEADGQGWAGCCEREGGRAEVSAHLAPQSAHLLLSHHTQCLPLSQIEWTCAASRGGFTRRGSQGHNACRQRCRAADQAPRAKRENWVLRRDGRKARRQSCDLTARLQGRRGYGWREYL